MLPLSLLGATTTTGNPTTMACLVVKELLDLRDLHDYVHRNDGQHELGAKNLTDTQGYFLLILTSLDSLDTNGDQMSI